MLNPSNRKQRFALGFIEEIEALTYAAQHIETAAQANRDFKHLWSQVPGIYPWVSANFGSDIFAAEFLFTLCNKGKELFTQFSFTLADRIPWYEKTIQAAEIYQRPFELIFTQVSLADTYNSLGRLEAGLQLLEKVHEHIQAILRQTAESNVDYKTAEYHLLRYMRVRAPIEAKLGRVLLAKDLRLAAFELAEKLDNRYELVVLLNFLGGSEKNLSRKIEIRQRAYTLAREIGHPRQIGITTSNLGQIYIRAGQLSLAQTYLQEALELALSLDIPSAVRLRLSALGSICNLRGEHEAALNYYQDALRIEENLGRAGRVRKNYMAATYLFLGNYKKAQAWFDKAIASNESSKPSLLTQYKTANLNAEILIAKKQYQAALEILLKAQKIEERIEDFGASANYFEHRLLLAEIYLYQAEYTTVLDCLKGVQKHSDYRDYHLQALALNALALAVTHDGKLASICQEILNQSADFLKKDAHFFSAAYFQALAYTLLALTDSAEQSAATSQAKAAYQAAFALNPARGVVDKALNYLEILQTLDRQNLLIKPLILGLQSSD